MNCRNVFSCALGLGLAGGLVGLQAYMVMSPHGQKEIRKTVSKAADELVNVAENIGHEIKEMR